MRIRRHVLRSLLPEARFSRSFRYPSPLTIFVLPWLILAGLWAMDITIYTRTPFSTMLLELLFVVVPPLVGWVAMFAIGRNGFVPRGSTARWNVGPEDCRKLNGALVWLLAALFGLLGLEVAIFRYIPLISMMTGGSLTHFDFGLPGLHGMLYALGAGVGTFAFLLYRVTGRKAYLAVMLAILVVFALLVTRKMIIITAIQCSLLFLMTSRLRDLYKVGIAGLLVIWVFGLIGDVRTGRDVILALSGLKVDYPRWLPSGLVWVYLYLITPLANYLRMIEIGSPPTWSFEFVYNGLVPVNLINKLMGRQVNAGGSFSEEWQIADAFNVAIGQASSYLSFGRGGVVALGLAAGAATATLFRSRNVFGLLAVVVLMECGVMMVFNNNYLSLNVVFQVPLFLALGRLVRVAPLDFGAGGKGPGGAA